MQGRATAALPATAVSQNTAPEKSGAERGGSWPLQARELSAPVPGARCTPGARAGSGAACRGHRRPALQCTRAGPRLRDLPTAAPNEEMSPSPELVGGPSGACYSTWPLASPSSCGNTLGRPFSSEAGMHFTNSIEPQ
ncbi:hypothetical protein TREES_T100018033 [Tupaia chinensis]|uniref:Uncharacterized protein n=1 Tax=Tupaia chinensis TaxID=246437 RepID=L9JDA0_TUPCH|nr:hypothetical protein TREES_T100018033 [Tupaia chinensis]